MKICLLTVAISSCFIVIICSENELDNSLEVPENIDKRIIVDAARNAARDVKKMKHEQDLSIEESTNRQKNDNKETHIRNIVKKIEAIVLKAIDNFDPLETKKKNVEILKKQILKTFRQELMKKEKNISTVDLYSNVISDGIDATVLNVFQKDTRRLLSDQFDADRDVAMEAVRAAELVVQEKSTKPPMQHLNIVTPKNFDCDNLVSKVCDSLRSIDTFVCEDNVTTLATKNVCDGAQDCPDGSDEKNCVVRVTEKVYNAVKIISTIELARFCFKILNDESKTGILSTQGRLLTSILEGELRILNKQEDKKQIDNVISTTESLRQEIKNKTVEKQDLVYRIASEISVIIRTFSSSLSGTLCAPTAPILVDVKSRGDIEFENAIMEDWNPVACECKGGKCANGSTCKPQCQKLCEKISMLSRFGCISLASNQLNSISLDSVCDGKTDCYDESDEIGCDGKSPISKFEGTKTYNEIIKLLHAKSLSRDYEPVIAKLVDLSAEIKNLQLQSTHKSIKSKTFKLIRNNCFKMLKMVYKDMAEALLPHYEKDLEPIYEFLLSVRDQLIVALKYSNIGNERLVSPNECSCHGLECAHFDCTTHCIKVCQVKIYFTSYACNDNTLDNVTVPITNICDGKIQCPNANDELYCKQDICGPQHLKLLQAEIDVVVKKYKESSLGPVLENWRDEIKGLFTIGLQKQKVNIAFIKAVIHKLVSDLSIRYVTLKKFRRVIMDNMKMKLLDITQDLLQIAKACKT